MKACNLGLFDHVKPITYLSHKKSEKGLLIPKFNFDY